MIKSNLKVLIAKENVKRAEAKQPALTIRGLARETGLTLSVVSNFAINRSTRVDYNTLDHLCEFFKVGVGEVLIHEPSKEGESN